MTGGSREAPVNVSPAVAANAEGEEIEVLESTVVLPVAPEDVVSPHKFISQKGPSFQKYVQVTIYGIILQSNTAKCQD